MTRMICLRASSDCKRLTKHENTGLGWVIAASRSVCDTPMKNHPHPGELLREDVLVPLGIEVTEAAQRLGLARTTLSRIINGKSGISPDLAIRLERAGVSTARFWMNLQSNYELSKAEERGQPQVRPLQTIAA